MRSTDTRVSRPSSHVALIAFLLRTLVRSIDLSTDLPSHPIVSYHPLRQLSLVIRLVRVAGL
jgi:hypothetical protein